MAARTGSPRAATGAVEARPAEAAGEAEARLQVHAQGAPCWVSLMTTDLPAAADFYAALLGWEFAPGPKRLGPYVRATVDGLPVAGIGEVDPGLGFPVEWVTYFAAEHADSVAARVREHGGTLALGPMDSEQAGRIAVGADPDGAVFGIWEGREHPGWQLRNTPGASVWSELSAPSVARSVAFYTGVFRCGHLVGFAPHGDRAVLTADGGALAGIHRGAEGERRRWRTYFAVPDLDAAVRRAIALGGSQDQHQPRFRLAPEEAPGEEAYLRDPQGGPFTLVQR